MRLGIITGNTAARADGRVWLNHSNGRTFDELRERFPGARICLPVLPGSPSAVMNHALSFPDADIEVLPPLVTTVQSQRWIWQTRKALVRFASSVDALFIRLPFQLPLTLLGLPRPKVLHVVSDPREVIRVSTDYRGLTHVLARLFAWQAEWGMARLVAEPGNRLVSNGQTMWERLQAAHGRVVVSSCLREAEMQPRADWALSQPPRLLFLGFLRPEKGVDVLLDAFEILRKSRPLRLTLAGGADRASGAEGHILARVRQHAYSSDIDVTGLVDFGPELFDLYRSHDAYVLPSLSEGTPRTLVEARAFGCPVIASRVGGVPTSIDEGTDGLMVPPGDAPALAAAIARLLDDQDLRRQLIGNGLARARATSLESFVSGIETELRALPHGVAGATTFLSDAS